ncbi:MAG: hypothetical protein IID41_16495, partial [Planctomycetes bacterium]|nr:hypothetical protein [Planctomycetota bacterium]
DPLTVAQTSALVKELTRKPLAPPKADTYRILYADPPWKYSDELIDGYGAAVHHYPPLSIQELEELELAPGKPVKEWVQPDAVLFLWTTSPKLEESIDLLRAWEFSYRTCAVWDKEKIGMGYYFRQQHELLLVATRGSLPVPEPERRTSSVFRSPRGKHSEKPDCVYEMIELAYPDPIQLLEMYQRKPRERWHPHGNEAM